MPWLAYAAIYFSLALGAGALLTWAVERPFLTLRDRLFPSGVPRARPEEAAPLPALIPGLVLSES